MGNIRESSASGRPVRDAHAARLERLPGRTSSCGSIRKTLRLSVCALAAGGLLHALPAQAVEFGSGEIQGSFDTTLSHGVTWRTGKRDDGLTGPNSDDGGRNYDRGIVSNTSKVTGELQIDHGNFGAFARFSGFIDFENQNGDRGHRPLSQEAKDLAGKNLEVLDLYVTGTFDAGEAPVDLRLGNHVLNWGESTFIQNGINVINPFDVTKLRTPGAELREALEPVPLFSASVAPTAELSLEGFYQLDWKKTEIDPPGTYFSTNDYVGAGGNRAYLTDPRFITGNPPSSQTAAAPPAAAPCTTSSPRGPSMPTSRRSPRRPREWPWNGLASPRAPVLPPPLPERTASPSPTAAFSVWRAGRTAAPKTRASGGSPCATSPRT